MWQNMEFEMLYVIIFISVTIGVLVGSYLANLKDLRKNVKTCFSISYVPKNGLYYKDYAMELEGAVRYFSGKRLDEAMGLFRNKDKNEKI